MRYCGESQLGTDASKYILEEEQIVHLWNIKRNHGGEVNTTARCIDITQLVKGLYLRSRTTRGLDLDKNRWNGFAVAADW